MLQCETNLFISLRRFKEPISLNRKHDNSKEQKGVLETRNTIEIN